MPGFNRFSKRGLLVEINPYQILVAGITRMDETPLVLDSAAEFDSDDDEGLQRWLNGNFDTKTTWLPVIAGFVRPDVLLQRETIVARRLIEPDYLPKLAREQYKIEHPENWTLAALSHLEGVPLAKGGNQRPALVSGVSHSDIHDIQQRLLNHRLLPYRLEMGILPLLGVISDYKNRRSDKRAVVVANIEHEHTVVYILGNEGVHTSATVRHGFASIVQAVRKDFGLTEAATVRHRLHRVDEELLLRGPKLVRVMGHDLKAVVDSYELTTGQPVGEIYFAYLPPALAWLTEPLAQVVGRTPFAINCTEWLPTVNLRAADNVPAFGPHWLGALSLVADLPRPTTEESPKGDTVYLAPWHIDCRLSVQLPSDDLVRRQFIASAIAGSIAALLLILVCWQLYIGNSLRGEIRYWQGQMAAHKRQYVELTKTTKQLDAKLARLDAAYELMGAPFQVSKLLLDIGRTRLPRMKIVSISGSATGVVIRGTLGEPSEQAAQTLKRYVEDLRQDPAIGPLFSAIVLSSLERAEAVDLLSFEIACKLKGAPDT